MQVEDDWTAYHDQEQYRKRIQVGYKHVVGESY